MNILAHYQNQIFYYKLTIWIMECFYKINLSLLTYINVLFKIYRKILFK